MGAHPHWPRRVQGWVPSPVTGWVLGWVGAKVGTRVGAPTLAKVGHGVGPRVGNRVGTKVTGWLSGWASRSQGGWQVAKLRAKVGVGVGAKDPRWVPRNQGGCLGGCRGGSQGGSQGECKGGCQGQGECQCGFQGARVRVSANVGSKVLSWVRGWVRGWVGAKHPHFWPVAFSGSILSFWASEHVSSPKTQYLFIKSRKHIFVLVDPSWVLERICGPWVPFCIPKLVFWCLIPILGAHLAPSAHPGANRAPWCTGARSSVHPRRPEHAPRCTRPTCERRSLRPRWCVGTALQTGHCTHTTHPSRCTHVGRAGCTPDALARCAHPGRAHTWRTGRTSRGRVCTSTGVGGRGGFARGSRFAKYTLRQAHNGCDHTSVSAPDPIRTPQLSALGPE
ncbi:hypothetical protein SUGI_1478790 [Cryptomeria japonica]|uniref:Uncharacterized protein n=1 Tax=Cryptomeria japonica TaxID=3369 RepID=A0AAD3RRM9_CRYJA|nr:hypothetical protein SUGI_1478790 [Cryptomeria japonica]